MSEALLIVALGLIVLAAVAYPLVAGRSRYEDADSLEADLARYRAAVAAGTVCPRCKLANDPGSRFCAECGDQLAPAA